MAKSSYHPDALVCSAVFLHRRHGRRALLTCICCCWGSIMGAHVAFVVGRAEAKEASPRAPLGRRMCRTGARGPVAHVARARAKCRNECRVICVAAPPFHFHQLFPLLARKQAGSRMTCGFFPRSFGGPCKNFNLVPALSSAARSASAPVWASASN